MKALAAALLALLVPAGPVCAQLADDPLYAVEQPHRHSTGVLVNRGATTVMAARHRIRVPGAPSLRVFFEQLALGPGAWVDVTGTEDGWTHRITADEAAKWRDSSAFFNGEALVLELFLGPGGGGGFTTGHLLVGVPIMHLDTICGPTDDRVPSLDSRVARLLNGTGTAACTGWLVSSDDCAFTAGHCAPTYTATAEFNTPPSTVTGALQHPPPQDQYPVDPQTVTGSSGGVGNDWAVMKLLPNNLGQSATSNQGWFTLETTSVPGVSSTVRVTGYGTTLAGTTNQIQQTHSGPLVGTLATSLQYQVDTTGGNSGSPVIDVTTGKAVGIHTHGGCHAGGGSNSGTSLLNPALLAAYQALCSQGPVFTLSASSSGGGTGDLVLQVTNLPASATEGYTLVSFDTSLPPGNGTILGINADLVTLAVMARPAADGDPLHWNVPGPPGGFPATSYTLGPGSLSIAPGVQMDAQAVALGPGFVYLDSTGVVRVTF